MCLPEWRALWSQDLMDLGEQFIDEGLVAHEASTRAGMAGEGLGAAARSQPCPTKVRWREVMTPDMEE